MAESQGQVGTRLDGSGPRWGRSTALHGKQSMPVEVTTPPSIALRAMECSIEPATRLPRRPERSGPNRAEQPPRGANAVERHGLVGRCTRCRREMSLPRAVPPRPRGRRSVPRHPRSSRQSAARSETRCARLRGGPGSPRSWSVGTRWRRSTPLHHRRARRGHRGCGHPVLRALGQAPLPSQPFRNRSKIMRTVAATPS